MEIRPPSRVFMKVAKPSPAGPSRCDRGMRASWKTRLAQSEPRMPSLVSPGSRVKPSMSRGTTKAEIPLDPRERSVTAVTMKTPAWFAFVMKHFRPLRMYSSPSSSAVVAVPPESEPAPGSVSP